MGLCDVYCFNGSPAGVLLIDKFSVCAGSVFQIDRQLLYFFGRDHHMFLINRKFLTG